MSRCRADACRASTQAIDGPTGRASLLVQRTCACGGAAHSLTGECADCRDRRLGVVRRKLTVGPAADAYEREADRVADSIASGVTDAPQRSTPISRVSRAPSADGAPQNATGGDMQAPSSVHRVLAEPGRPLDAGSRAFRIL